MGCPRGYDDTLEWRRRDGKGGPYYGDVAPGPEWDDVRVVCMPRGAAPKNWFTRPVRATTLYGLGAAMTPEAVAAHVAAQQFADERQTPVAIVEANAAVGSMERRPVGAYDLIAAGQVPANVEVFETVEPRFFSLRNPQMLWVGGGVGLLGVLGIGGWLFFRRRRR